MQEEATIPENLFMSLVKLVRGSTFDSDMIRNLLASPISDVSAPPHPPLSFVQARPSQAPPEIPPNLTMIIGSLGESTYNFLDETQKVQPSEKVTQEEPSDKDAEKIASEAAKEPSLEEKSTKCLSPG